MKRTLVAFLAALFLFSFTTTAQRTSTSGKEFYVAFYKNSDDVGITTSLFLTSAVNTSGTITNPNSGYSKAFSISAGSVTTVAVPLAEAYNTISGTVNNQGLIVTAKDTISLYALNNRNYSSDATGVIQKNALGTDYMIATYPGVYFGQYDYISSCFLIEATEDSTIVKITPSIASKNSNAAGVPFTVKLNKGQTYLVGSNNSDNADLSGSLISVTNGCKPIAVFSGTANSYIPHNYYASDMLCEQLFPISSFGKQFITASIKGRNVYRARVYAAYDNTAIQIDGASTATINSGKYYEFESNNQPRYITTSSPTEVMLFATGESYDTLKGPYNDGDPTMMTVPPLEQQLRSTIFLSPSGSIINSHRVSIVCKTADAPNTLLDGTNIGNAFAVVAGNPLYSYAALNIAAGQHAISNPSGFTAYAYGFGNFQGYGYNTGSSVENIDTYFTCNDMPSIGNPTVDICPSGTLFKIIATGANAGYSWDFGDGTAPVTTNGQILSQTHTYATPGNYLVTLTTTGTVSTACSPNAVSTSQITVHVVSSLTPSISLVANPAAPACKGTNIVFVASAINTGPAAIYQWAVNGISTGTNSPTFSTSALSDKDVVTCMVTSSLSCASSPTASASLAIQMGSAVMPSISIALPYTSVCHDSLAKFTATVPAGITSPTYQWTVNGVKSGTNSASFSYYPKAADLVACTLTIANGCNAINTAVSNTVTVGISQGTSITSVEIAAAQNPVCFNTNAVFTATPKKVGATPTYQWKLNGNNVGNNDITYSSANLQPNDVVGCVMTSYSDCGEKLTAVANNITVQITAVPVTSVTINTPKTSICQGDLATFTATPTNGGSLPIYQWSLNGVNTGSNSSTYASSNLANGDVVACAMISNANCAVGVNTSNLVTIMVTPIIHPTISISTANNPICKTENAVFSASITYGGTSPMYYWMVNGTAASPSGTAVFSSSSLSDGDKINCRLVSSLACATEGLAQDIVMKVYPKPAVAFNPSEVVILYGTTYQLKPEITGAVNTYAWTPPGQLDNAAIANPTTSTLTDETYHLTVTNSDACTANADMKIIVFRDLIMPTGFTPNGDGNNDLFGIPTLYHSLKVHHFTVYSRWGAKIFETTDSNKKWDGTISGAQQPNGVYVWLVEYENPFTHKTILANGTVLLIR